MLSPRAFWARNQLDLINASSIVSVSLQRRQDQPAVNFRCHLGSFVVPAPWPLVLSVRLKFSLSNNLILHSSTAWLCVQRGEKHNYGLLIVSQGSDPSNTHWRTRIFQLVSVSFQLDLELEFGFILWPIRGRHMEVTCSNGTKVKVEVGMFVCPLVTKKENT